VIRIKNKIVKYSLKSSNLKYCNIIKLKLLRFLDKELNLINYNRTFTIHFIEDDEDDPVEVEKIKNKLRQVASDELSNGNINKLDINDSKSITIKEAIEKFLDYKENVEKVKDATLSNYKSSFNYLYLFITDKTNIKILNKRFFNELQNKFMKIPKDYLKAKNRKDINEILENKNDLVKLDNGTINKHFMVYKSLYDFLVRNDYIQKNTVEIKYLKEDNEIKKEEFEYEELDDLFNLKSIKKTKDSDEEVQNFFKFAYLTGMRLGEILRLKIEDIVEIQGHKIIDIKEAKNPTSIRIIPINEDIEIILNEQIPKSKNGYIFVDYQLDNRFSSKANPIGKRLNLKINNYLKSKNKDNSIKSFHSFRKNFTQTLYLERFQLKEIVISKLLGHSVEGNITRKVYNRNKVEREALINAMSCIKLSDIKNLKNENLYFEVKPKSEISELNSNLDIVF
jgi:integrase